MAWLELRIHTKRTLAPFVEDALSDAGALAVTLQDDADQPIYEPGLGETPLWQQTRVTGLFEADIDTRAIEDILNLPETCMASWHNLEDKDWEREWMQHYRPVHCGGQLWICPSWQDPPQPDAINLLLDPGLAFGTGSHPTTFLCLQWLSKQRLQGLSLLDYGCGSGILAIAGLLLGAQTATGVDIDPQALQSSRANAQRNKLANERLTLHLPEQLPAEQYPVVVANILAGPLVSLAPVLFAQLRVGGALCLSGVLAEQATTVMQAYENQIEFDPVQERENWVCLSGRKRQGATSRSG